MTRPSLTPDQLLRIEALKIANSLHIPQEFGVMPPDAVTDRAAVYLAFLKEKNTLHGFPLTYNSSRKK